MGVTVHINLDGLRQKLSEKRLIQARKLAANDARQAMDKYVPYLSGALSKQSFVNDDGSQIWYTVPYAKAQFYGKVGKGSYPVHHWTTATHPKATKRWDLAMKGNDDDMKRVEEAFTKGLGWSKK